MLSSSPAGSSSRRGGSQKNPPRRGGFFIRNTGSDALRASPFLPHIGDDPREKRQEHDQKDDRQEIAIDIDDTAERIAEQHESYRPDQRSDEIIEEECPIMHIRHAGHDRRKCPDDRHKARQHDHLRPVIVIEHLRLARVRFLENKRVFAAEKFRPYAPAEFIAKDVSEDCGNEQSENKNRQREKMLSRQKSRYEEQAVPRQEKSEK